MEVVKALESLGVEEIQACCVHAAPSGDAPRNFETRISQSWLVTDTVYIPEEKKIPSLK